MGSQFPEIRSLELSNVELHETEGHIESLDILMDLHYKGDFQLKIDADMVLGKKGSLSMRGTSRNKLFLFNPYQCLYLNFSEAANWKGTPSIYT